MKWIGITGSWRYDLPQLRQDVQAAVDKILAGGNGVVTGGALGVDFWATERVIKHKAYNNLKIYLPTN